LTARLIDGKAIAAEVRAEVGDSVEAFIASHGRAPVLATVLVGEDPASQVYVANKHRACEEVGIESRHLALSADATEDEVLARVRELGEDTSVDGILVQLPVPDQVSPDLVIESIPYQKDVDGLNPYNAGLLASGSPGMVPCTPAGVIDLLVRTGTEIRGSRAVVIGRSNLVGRPVASLLLDRDATVTICHSKTADLAGECRGADILVAAVGIPEMIRADWVKPGATVIDVGINRTEDGLVGDVDFAAVSEVAGAITPVPGGVGPMTIAMLMANTLAAAESREATKGG
jgi:methylenetetrahydrofolate dehydrogenase (NADP+) / methenyltetrahydrofolate cyclohydrolase